VDDEPEIARMLAEILEPMARRIDVAENGLAALARLGETPYDVIISDLRMPELDGPGLYRRIRDQGAGLDARMIFVTGDTLHHNLEAFLRSSGVPVIEKPFHPKDVRRRVAEFLERSGSNG
jgi:two-component system NtrC family sensor kinase